MEGGRERGRDPLLSFLHSPALAVGCRGAAGLGWVVVVVGCWMEYNVGGEVGHSLSRLHSPLTITGLLPPSFSLPWLLPWGRKALLRRRRKVFFLRWESLAVQLEERQRKREKGATTVHIYTIYCIFEGGFSFGFLCGTTFIHFLAQALLQLVTAQDRKNTYSPFMNQKGGRDFNAILSCPSKIRCLT